MKRIATYVLVAAITTGLLAPVAVAGPVDRAARPVAGWWSFVASWAQTVIEVLLPTALRPGPAIAAEDDDCGATIDPIGHCLVAPSGDGEENSAEIGATIDPIG